MFPVAAICGNTYVLKPSERDPGCTMMLMELAQEAGFPAGVVNVIHGTHDSVNFILRNPHIEAVSFVGSDQAGKYIYEEGSKHGKRVQSNMGAKNHGVVMPDANKESCINQVCYKKLQKIHLAFICMRIWASPSRRDLGILKVDLT